MYHHSNKIAAQQKGESLLLYAILLVASTYGFYLRTKSLKEEQFSLAIPISKVKIYYGYVQKDAIPKWAQSRKKNKNISLDLSSGTRTKVQLFAVSDGTSFLGTSYGTVHLKYRQTSPRLYRGQMLAIASTLSERDWNGTPTLHSSAYGKSIRVLNINEMLDSPHSLTMLEAFLAELLMREETDLLFFPTRLRFLWKKKQIWQQFLVQNRIWFQKTIETFLQNYLAVRGRDLFNALIWGVKTEISHPVYTQFQKAGIMHLLSLSGFHVSILVSILTFLIRPILGKQRSFFFCSLILLFYWWIIGPLVSLSRAVLMFFIFSCFQRYTWTAKPLLIWCISLILQSQIFPSSPLQIGFQLSYVSLLGLILLSHPSMTTLQYFYNVVCIWIKKRLSHHRAHYLLQRTAIAKWIDCLLSKIFLRSIGVSTAVTILNAPILLFHFGEIQWIGIFSNIVVTPLLILYIVFSLFLLPIIFLSYAVQAPSLIALNLGIYRGLYDLCIDTLALFASVPSWNFLKNNGNYKMDHLLYLYCPILFWIGLLFRYEIKTRVMRHWSRHKTPFRFSK